MACHRTKPAWKVDYPNHRGKYPITFRKPQKYRPPDYYVPCGKCLGCKSDNARDWAIRIDHEAKEHEYKCFLTLTYSDEYLPPAIDRHLLTKKLYELKRKIGVPIRYFAVGEYGERTKRPHYHAVLYGTDLLAGSSPTHADKYIHPIITGLWPYGYHEIQPYDDGTACYTAGYVTKKIGNEDTFSIKSTRPPLGKAHLLKYPDRFIAQGTTIVNGTELPIPKLYLDWLERAGHNVDETRELIRETSRKKRPISDREGRSKDLNAKAKLERRGERI